MTDIPLLYVRILSFCLVPIGVWLLIKGIQWIRRSFKGQILLELPYTTGTAVFEVMKPGVYALWQRGQLFKKTPVDKFKPVLYHVETDTAIRLQYSILRPSVNDFDHGRTELYTFYANAGIYKLELQEGSNVSAVEQAVAAMLPLPNMGHENYSIQIRKSQAQIFVFLSIPMILLGITGIMGGLVMGIFVAEIIQISQPY